jgi:cellobiose transport system substrate-binding protein
MDLTRRRLLQVSLLGMAGAAVGATAGCGSSGGGTADKSLSLWYWPGGLSEKVVADAVKQFPQAKLKASQIGGQFKDKLLTTMSSRRFVPDITGIKGEDMAAFAVQAGQFVDLRELGADKLKSQFLEWKWKKGSTPDGKLIGFPIDIGPTGLYYRQDVYAKAGLPTEPDEVSAAMATWDGFFEAGVKLKKAVPDAYMVQESTSVFGMVVGQNPKRFIDEANHFIGDQDHIRTAWDLSIKPIELGINARVKAETQDQNAAWTNGTIPSVLGAAWLALDIKSGAESTSGKWRVAATPGGPSNIGGSFLAIPKASKDPQLAFQIVTWLLSPENQARGFTDAALFPSTPATYAMPALAGPDPFFGGQKTIEVFGPAAEKIPISYESPHDAAVSEPYYVELSNVETQGKKPDVAWNDAVNEAKKVADRLGVG